MIEPVTQTHTTRVEREEFVEHGGVSELAADRLKKAPNVEDGAVVMNATLTQIPGTDHSKLEIDYFEPVEVEAEGGGEGDADVDGFDALRMANGSSIATTLPDDDEPVAFMSEEMQESLQKEFYGAPPINLQIDHEASMTLEETRESMIEQIRKEAADRMGEEELKRLYPHFSDAKGSFEVDGEEIDVDADEIVKELEFEMEAEEAVADGGGWVETEECPGCGDQYDPKTEGIEGDDGTEYCSLECLNEVMNS